MIVAYNPNNGELLIKGKNKKEKADLKKMFDSIKATHDFTAILGVLKYRNRKIIEKKQ